MLQKALAVDAGDGDSVGVEGDVVTGSVAVGVGRGKLETVAGGYAPAGHIRRNPYTTRAPAGEILCMAKH